MKTRFGLNYVPSGKWWYSWVDWDRSAIADDLAAIASLGMDHIRIHCLWPVFQPNANLVSPLALDRLCELLELADQAKLDVTVAVLDGWLSGFAFYPAWRKNANIFTDEAIIRAQERLFTAIAARVAGHRRFLGFDLGNELGVLAGDNPHTADQADAWQERMFAVCQRVAPGKFHVNGVDHCHWFGNIGFTRPALATTGSATSVHAWIEFTGFSAAFGASSEACEHLAEYSIELARAYHVAPDRPIWLQEFGSSSLWMPAERIPHFAERTYQLALSCPNLWGCTWWCSHDLSPALEDFHPLEYDLGLLNHRNQIKPAGAHIASLIRRWHANPPTLATRPRAVVISEAIFASPEGGITLARKWVEHITNGLGPAFVRECLAHDAKHLQSRGITKLVG